MGAASKVSALEWTMWLHEPWVRDHDGLETKTLLVSCQALLA